MYLLAANTWFRKHFKAHAVPHRKLFIMLFFQTETAVQTFLDKTNNTENLLLFFFITLAKVCERKHFAPKLLITVYHQYQAQT